MRATPSGTITHRQAVVAPIAWKDTVSSSAFATARCAARFVKYSLRATSHSRVISGSAPATYRWEPTPLLKQEPSRAKTGSAARGHSPEPPYPSRPRPGEHAEHGIESPRPDDICLPAARLSFSRQPEPPFDPCRAIDTGKLGRAPNPKSRPRSSLIMWARRDRGSVLALDDRRTPDAVWSSTMQVGAVRLARWAVKLHPRTGRTVDCSAAGHRRRATRPRSRCCCGRRISAALAFPPMPSPCAAPMQSSTLATLASTAFARPIRRCGLAAGRSLTFSSRVPSREPLDRMEDRRFVCRSGRHSPRRLRGKSSR